MLISKELDRTRAHLNFMTKHRQTLTFSVHCIAYSTVSNFAKFWLKNVKLFWPNKQVDSILSNCCSFIQYLLFWMKIYLRIISYFTFLDKDWRLKKLTTFVFGLFMTISGHFLAKYMILLHKSGSFHPASLWQCRVENLKSQAENPLNWTLGKKLGFVVQL